jgi:hypothetical protein
LIINSTINQTNTTTITEDITQQFTQTFGEGTYSWSVNCTNEVGLIGESGTRIFTIDLTAPTVQLIEPNNGNTTTDRNITFSCNATNLQLSNISLWHNINGAWQLNQTDYVSGIFNESSFNVTDIPDGTYDWNCQACDTSGNCDFAIANWTFTIIFNFPPSIAQVILNSTYGTNLTTENLTRYLVGVIDLDNDPVKNITNWYVDGNSITIFNMPFENNINNVSATTKDYSRFSNNGTVVNGMIWDSNGGYDGKGAYLFDGIDDYVETNSINHNIGSGDFAFEAWIYLRNNLTYPRIS